MRFTPAAVTLAVLFAVSSSVSVGQKPAPIDARSQHWAQQGMAAFGAGRFDAAIDAFETALVLDPRNEAAYAGLARVATAQDLPGKAIRYYDEVLALDPQYVAALEGQGVAMLKKGAVESARGNLARIKDACKKGCDAADKLASAIATNGVAPPRIVSTSALTPQGTAQPIKE